MLSLIISETSNKPIYQQIFEQISAQIMKGELEKGYLLPPIRTVAKELRISVITIKKAWEELERYGFINSMVGRGCFVADLSAQDLNQKRIEIIDKKISKDAAYFKELGLSLEELMEAFKKYYS